MQLRLSQIFLLFILLTGLCNRVVAQTTFTATITPTIIQQGETAELKLVVMNASKVKWTLPALNKFTIISGPGEESGTETTGGGYVSMTYLLMPKSKGNFTIAATSVIADGKKIKGNRVNLQVLSDATANAVDEGPEKSFNDFILKEGENTKDKISKNIFVQVTASKTSCYIGEPVLVTYKLYTRLKSESNFTKPSSLNGFSVIDLATGSSGKYVAGNFNGRDYNVYTLRKAQLFPLQQGAITIEPAGVENDICFIKEDYLKKHNLQEDIFRDMDPPLIPAEAMINERVMVQSSPLVITVKPLPLADKPVSFKGAVGNFAIGAAIKNDSFSTADAGRLRIVIQGEGNLPLVNVPEFVWPAGIEVLEPETRETINRLSVPVSGVKTFEYVFTVAKEGSYTIPAIEYSFFDVAASRYKTISTRPIVFKVVKASGKKQPLPGAEDTITRESFFEVLFTKRWLIIVPLALLILTGLIVWLRADEKQQQKVAAANKAEQQSKGAALVSAGPPKNPLKQTEAMLVQYNTNGFYAALNKELRIFLADRLQLAPENMNKKNIDEGLDRSGFSIEMSKAVQHLLDEISLQLYTPFADETKLQAYYEKAILVVQAFDKKGI